MSIILLISFSLIWIASEAYLVIKDMRNGKGMVSSDHKSRNLNIIATIVSLTIPYIFLLIGNNPQNNLVTLIGASIALLGYVFRHWAILTLGKHFRTTIEIEKNQEIIKSGPYKYIRHPSYSGMILFFIGFGILVNNWICAILTPIMIIVVLVYRIGYEEKEFENIIGKEYVEYKRKTKRLIPWIW